MILCYVSNNRLLYFVTIYTEHSLSIIIINCYILKCKDPIQVHYFIHKPTSRLLCSWCSILETLRALRRGGAHVLKTLVPAIGSSFNKPFGGNLKWNPLALCINDTSC